MSFDVSPAPTAAEPWLRIKWTSITSNRGQSDSACRAAPPWERRAADWQRNWPSARSFAPSVIDCEPGIATVSSGEADNGPRTRQRFGVANAGELRRHFLTGFATYRAPTVGGHSRRARWTSTIGTARPR